MLAKTELKVTLVVPRCPPKLAEMIREREILRVAASNIAEMLHLPTFHDER